MKRMRMFYLGILFILEAVYFINESYAQELRDVRPPVDVPEFPWVWVLSAVVLAVLLIKLGMAWAKKRDAKKVLQEPWEIAGQELESLRRKDLAGQGQFKELYMELAVITRNYIEQRFDVRAPDMTTEEFLERMRSSAFLQDSHKELLKELLKTADMVKFARYEPGVEEAAAGFECVKRFIQETKLDTKTVVPEGAGLDKS